MAPRSVRGKTRGRTAGHAAVTSRPFRTLTLSPRCEAILTALTRDSGLARGRIVDQAVEAMVVCDQCDGTGLMGGSLGPGTITCSECGGNRLLVRP